MPATDIEIRVYKKTRILELWQNQQLSKTFVCGIGRNEKGHKHREGDLKTPEGDYHICVKNPKSKFYLSLGINYPNDKDASSARDGKQISDEQFKEICIANSELRVPLWNTVLGGQIYIHGELEQCETSEGCVRLFNRDIEKLFALVEKGTKVKIYP